MKILSIDTSSPVCAVAILEDNNLIKELSQNNGLTHSEKLMPMISQILTETNLNLKYIDLLVCDKGPGSFTGIRIGVSTVKAFTDSLNIPCIGISSLEALAYNVNETGIICPLIDARNDNCYWGIFENINGKYKQLYSFSVDNISIILNKLKHIGASITFVGDGSICFRNQIEKELPNSKFSSKNDLSAFNLGLAGLNYFKSNSNKTDELLPLYLRAPKAEQLLKENLNE